VTSPPKKKKEIRAEKTATKSYLLLNLDPLLVSNIFFDRFYFACHEVQRWMKSGAVLVVCVCACVLQTDKTTATTRTGKKSLDKWKRESFRFSLKMQSHRHQNTKHLQHTLILLLYLIKLFFILSNNNLVWVLADLNVKTKRKVIRWIRMRSMSHFCILFLEERERYSGRAVVSWSFEVRCVHCPN
jgi:hypothetical protein